MLCTTYQVMSTEVIEMTSAFDQAWDLLKNDASNPYEQMLDAQTLQELAKYNLGPRLYNIAVRHIAQQREAARLMGEHFNSPSQAQPLNGQQPTDPQ